MCSQPVGDRRWEKRGDLWAIDLGTQECIWVPADEQLRMKLISEHHETVMAGHFGIKRTLARLRDRFRWDGMRKDIEEFVCMCDAC